MFIVIGFSTLAKDSECSCLYVGNSKADASKVLVSFDTKKFAKTMQYNHPVASRLVKSAAVIARKEAKPTTKKKVEEKGTETKGDDKVGDDKAGDEGTDSTQLE